MIVVMMMMVVVMAVIVLICHTWVYTSIWYHQCGHSSKHARASVSHTPVPRRGVSSGRRVTFIRKYHTDTTTLIALICCNKIGSKIKNIPILPEAFLLLQAKVDGPSFSGNV